MVFRENPVGGVTANLFSTHIGIAVDAITRIEGLSQRIVASDDQGRFPEDPRVIAHYEQLMRRNYDQKLEAAKRARGERN